MKQLAPLLALLLPLTASATDEHLVPEDSVFSEGAYEDYDLDRYYHSVMSVLKDAYAQETFARVIVLPSFWNEYAIAVSRKGGQYKIIHLTTDTSLYGFDALKDYKDGKVQITDGEGNSILDEEIAELEAKLPASIDDVVVEKCEIEIDEGLGDVLHTLWSEMLFRTRYADQRPVSTDGDDTILIRADGINYHFSFDGGIDRLTGQIWSPDEGSVTGKFVDITDAMRKACLSKDNGKLRGLRRSADALLVELSASPY